MPPQFIPPVADNFNRTPDETPVSDGGKWTTGGTINGPTSGVNLVSNALNRPSAGGGFARGGSYFNAYTTGAGNDCAVAVTITQMSAGTISGHGGELDLQLFDPSTKNGYQLGLNDQNWAGVGNPTIVLDKSAGGTITNLGALTSSPAPPQTGDIYLLEIVGNNVNAWLLRSGTWTQLFSVADTTYRLAFKAGIEMAGQSESAVLIADDASVGQLLKQTLSASSATSATITQLKVKLLSLAAAVRLVGGTQMPIIMGALPGGAILLKTVLKGLSASNGQAAKLVRQPAVVKTATQAQTATVATSRGARTITLTATNAQVASLARAAFRTLTATQASLASVVRSAARKLTATQAQTATVSSRRPTILFQAVSATQASASVMWFRRQLAISAASIGSLAISAIQKIQLIISPDEHA